MILSWHIKKWYLGTKGLIFCSHVFCQISWLNSFEKIKIRKNFIEREGLSTSILLSGCLIEDQ